MINIGILEFINIYRLSMDITPVVYKARWLIPPFFTAPFLTNSKILMHIVPLGLDIAPSRNAITYNNLRVFI